MVAGATIPDHRTNRSSGAIVQHTASPLNTIVPLLIVFALVMLRMSRMSTARPMRLKALWVRPAIFAALAAFLVYSAPPQGMIQYLVLVATLAAGALLGWHQGKLMSITVNEETGTLQVKASAWAVAAFLGVLTLRLVLRPWLTSTGSPLHDYVGVVTDAFLLFIVGFYGARACEMFIRGRALLAARQQSDQTG
jgi:hypothetical protein